MKVQKFLNVLKLMLFKFHRTLYLRQGLTSEYNQDKLISVYPNPIGNEMHIKMVLKESSSSVSFVIKDVAGKEVGKWIKKVFSDEDEIALNVSGLSNGVYYLCVTTDNMQWNGVVVKQNNH
jgi:hypothetical protein